MKKLLLISLLIVGCYSKITYTYFGYSNIDNRLTAEASFDKIYLYIDITNETSVPIFINYYLDKFEITDINGVVYVLGKSISYYPDIDFINPQQWIRYKFSDIPVEDENISFIKVMLAGSEKNTIFLNPNPQ